MLGLDGWLARAFLEKKLGKYGYGAYFSRKGLVCMAGARISRENAWYRWLGPVFLEGKLGMDGWAPHFSRKTLGLDG